MAIQKQTRIGNKISSKSWEFPILYESSKSPKQLSQGQPIGHGPPQACTILYRNIFISKNI